MIVTTTERMAGSLVVALAIVLIMRTVAGLGLGRLAPIFQ